MTISEFELGAIDRNVYKVDGESSHQSFKAGKVFSTGGGSYKIIDVEDNDQNGMQAIALAKIVDGEPDYSTIVVSYAGTGDGAYFGKDLADLDADASFVIGGNGLDDYGNMTDGSTPEPNYDNGEDYYGSTPGSSGKNPDEKYYGDVPKDSQIYSANEFAVRVKELVDKKYKGAKIIYSGHSLGAAEAMDIAARNQGEFVGFSGPDISRGLTKNQQIWILLHPDDFKNYRHKGDLVADDGMNRGLTAKSKANTGIWAVSNTDKLIDKHYVQSYEFDKDGNVKVEYAQELDFQSLEYSLSTINSLYKDTSVGDLTDSDKIFLDDIQAITIANGMKRVVTDGIELVKKDFNASLEELDPSWDDTLKACRTLAYGYLSESEILAALAEGGATYGSSVDSYKTLFQAKKKKAEDVEEIFEALTDKIITDVEAQVEHDRDESKLFKE